MAKVCCAIETEPKTLNQGQLHQAREVAADVVHRLEPNEASLVFVDGVSPMTSVEENKMGEEEEELKLEWKEEKYENGEGRRCQCSCVSTANSESPDHHHHQLHQLISQPLSAPF